MTKSELDEITGIGEVKKQALLKHFGSVEKIKEASIKELMEVKGISEAIAKKIWVIPPSAKITSGRFPNPPFGFSMECFNLLIIKISQNLMNVITKFQDTVHDTAISYHRKLRDKEMTKSELDEITGMLLNVGISPMHL